MDFKFKPSQKLLVSLHNGDIFEGIYQGGSKARIELTDVCEHPSGAKISCVFDFYRHEIESVKLLDTECVDTGSEKSSNENPEDCKHIILLQEAEYERLKDLSKKHIYMATMDNRFFEGTDYLVSCETVGVFGIGSELGRQGSISMLVLTAWDQVYLFDLLLYKSSRLHPKLKIILESDSIKKVVHDSRTLVDCLYHCHKTKLVNVFDTQVADLVLSKREGTPLKEARNLSECLQHYFNLPNSVLDKPLKISAEKWTARPVKDSRKIYAAQLGAYLITLKNLLERKLLQDYYAVVDEYAKYLKDMSLCDSANNVTRTVPPNIQGLL